MASFVPIGRVRFARFSGYIHSGHLFDIVKFTAGIKKTRERPFTLKLSDTLITTSQFKVAQ